MLFLYNGHIYLCLRKGWNPEWNLRITNNQYSAHAQNSSLQRAGITAQGSNIWNPKITFSHTNRSGPQFCQRNFPKKSMIISQWCPLLGLIFGFLNSKNGCLCTVMGWAVKNHTTTTISNTKCLCESMRTLFMAFIIIFHWSNALTFSDSQILVTIHWKHIWNYSKCKKLCKNYTLFNEQSL